MKFTRKSANTNKIEDAVFKVVNLAKQAKLQYGNDNVIDASIGALCDENGNLVTFNSVFKHYDEISHISKAKYAESFIGNTSYRKQVYNWVTQSINLNLHHDVIATIGGSGAVSLTFQNILEENEYVIFPDIAWGSYKLMATQNNLKFKEYQMFDNDKFNIKSLKETIYEVSKYQDNILIVINDPAHNPTGYSLSNDEWIEIINFVNEISKTKKVIILNDIAYIDYCYDIENSRNYLSKFNNISENVMVIIGFSCSKSLTSYGLRCGAAIILAKNINDIEDTMAVYEKSARALWSNIPNAGMDNFTWVTTDNLNNYLKEKQIYIDLLKQRTSIFLKEAKENNLEIYPYIEGFFITLKMKNNEERDNIHKKLIEKNIYTVCVNKGIRIAICSVPINKIYGLAKKIKEVF